MLRSVIVLLAAGVWAVQEAREFDNRGVQLAQSGNLTAAIDQFRAALGADPMYADGGITSGLLIVSRTKQTRRWPRSKKPSESTLITLRRVTCSLIAATNEAI